MLEELFNLVKEFSGDAVDNNPDVPNEKNQEVVAEATNTVASGFRNIVAGGGTQSLVQLLKQNNSSGNEKSGISSLLQNPIVSMMVGHFASKLMSKHKLGGNQANNIASSLIPNVINGLINKTNSNSGGGFSLENLLNSITGGQAQTAAQSNGLDIGGLISQFTGGDQGNNSGGGLMDIVKQMAGGAQQQQERNGGGGLMDLIKGFIK